MLDEWGEKVPCTISVSGSPRWEYHRCPVLQAPPWDLYPSEGSVVHIPWEELRCERQFRPSNNHGRSPQRESAERGERAMGLVVKTTLHPEQDEHGMPYEWFVGIDWGPPPAFPHRLSRGRRPGKSLRLYPTLA